jgi:hypothetical protein
VVRRDLTARRQWLPARRHERATCRRRYLDAPLDGRPRGPDRIGRDAGRSRRPAPARRGDRLGPQLVIIGATDGSPLAPNADSTSIDALLTRVGVPRFVVDLRAARADPSASAWLARERRLRMNRDTFITLAPATAFDALLYAGPLTAARSSLVR